jgi:hypothetical protein
MSIWRYRAELSAFADLPSVAAIRGREIEFTKLASRPTGEAIYLLDIFIEEPTAKDALLSGIDLGDEVADRIAYLSYAPASKWTISATRPVLGVGEQCELAVLHGAFSRGRSQITRDRLESLDCVAENSPTASALRSFRTGIGDPSPYRALMDFWRAAERLAEEDAKKKGYEVSKHCKQCGTLVESRPATQPAIVDLIRAVGEGFEDEAKAKEVAGSARRTRGGLVHGGKLADSALRREAQEHLLPLQPAAAIALARHIGVKTQSRESILNDVPITVLTLKRTGAAVTDFAIEDSLTGPTFAYEIRAAISKLPDEATDGPRMSIALGLAFPMPIDPRGLPVSGADILVSFGVGEGKSDADSSPPLQK